MDVRNRAGVQAWVDTVVAEYGHVDVPVNNAGVTRDGLLVKAVEGHLVGQISGADFDLVIDVNLKGSFNCAHAVVPRMIRQGVGVILNTSSVVGWDGNIGQTSYVASRCGVIGMTKVWACELGRAGIRVNAVCPGVTATEMLNSVPEKVLDSMKAKTPLGRFADLSDIANAYFFLVSDQATFITGAELRVDGGIVLGM